MALDLGVTPVRVAFFFFLMGLCGDVLDVVMLGEKVKPGAISD